jgi:hypothetical protein
VIQPHRVPDDLDRIPVALVPRRNRHKRPTWQHHTRSNNLTMPPKRPVTSTDTKIQTRRLDRRLSPDAIAELVVAYRTGTSTNQLCRQYGISKGGVLKILADHGITMRNQPMTADEIGETVRRYVDDGLSIRAIANQLGKSKGSVWKALHDRGVTMRPAH